MGHSDGDTVCHAVADALLGASALGDVGEHFPESDAAIEGISGSTLLRRVVELLGGAGFTPSSCDVTVVADRPAIAPRRQEIRSRLAPNPSVPAHRRSGKGPRTASLGRPAPRLGR